MGYQVPGVLKLCETLIGIRSENRTSDFFKNPMSGLS